MNNNHENKTIIAMIGGYMFGYFKIDAKDKAFYLGC
jgi:hypothetical protein